MRARPGGARVAGQGGSEIPVLRGALTRGLTLTAFEPLTRVPGVGVERPGACHPCGTHEGTYAVHLTGDDAFMPDGSPIIASWIHTEWNGRRALPRRKILLALPAAA